HRRRNLPGGVFGDVGDGLPHPGRDAACAPPGQDATSRRDLRGGLPAGYFAAMKTPRDPASQRLFLDPDLAAGARIALDRGQANYLVNVLRLGDGAELRVFNGRDGEWAARLVGEGKRAFRLIIERQTRPQPPPPDLHYLFAPLKQARLDYMVEKAVEMGAGCLRPVPTQHG